MRTRNQAGQALVEMALVMPLLLAMVLGVFGFGRLFNAQLVITNAGREGARLGALGRPDESIKAAITKYLSGGGLSDPLVAVTIDRTTGADGTDVKVVISYPFKSVMALPGLQDPLYLKTSAVMRQEMP